MKKKIKDYKLVNDDYLRFYKKEPDKDFSPKRNEAIVEGTIKKYEETRRKKSLQHDDNYFERSDAVVTYLKSLDRGTSESNLEKYFGRKMMAYLRGQQIRDQLMSGLTVKNNEGKIVRLGQ